MLTGELVRVRVKQKQLHPAFVKTEDPRMLERAEELLELFREGLAHGATRADLHKQVGEVIGDGIDHKLTRGLARIIEDRADFAVEAPIAPDVLRERLFTAVAEAPSRSRAAKAYAELSQELDSDPEELRRLLFADRKEEQQIGALDVPDAQWLLHRYNVALVQSCLFKASQVDIELVAPQPERLSQLFRAIKFHGLMYRAERSDEGCRVVLDGPASLLRLSTRYGRGLSNWFPSLLLQTCEWRLNAEVRWGARRLRKQLDLNSEMGLMSHYRDVGAWVSRTAQWFEERWERLDTDWTLERSGVVVDLGGQGVVCPDFTLRGDGRVAHLEIVGVWRKTWLRNRELLLRKHGPGNLILGVSSKLEGSKQGAGTYKGPVIPFKEILSATKVLAAAKACAVKERS